MNTIIHKKPISTTEFLFSESLTSRNRTILEQICRYKYTADIYERTQVALGRKVSVRFIYCSTEKVKINLQNIGATNKIQNNTGLA